MSPSKILGVLLLCCLMPVLLTGCGENLFKGLVSQPRLAASDYNGQGRYAEAISAADEILNSGSTSPEQKRAAAFEKATAILGQNNLDFSTIMIQVQEKVNSPSGTNLVELIGSLPGNITDLATAADLFNLSVSSTSYLSVGAPQPLTQSSTNTEAELRRGVANATVAVKMVTLYLDVFSAGTVSLNATAVADSVDEEDTLLYLTQSTKNVAYYADNAISAFTQAGSLDSSQLDNITKLQTSMTNLAALAQAVTGNTTYTSPASQSYSFATSNQTVRNSRINSAMGDIFGTN
ncbi:MAG: hypothetical protein AB7F28_08310 [Candidatus Margulisiibacteriota bacterium]